MKTNQILKVEFALGVVEIKHKDQMVELESFVTVLNNYRVSSGLAAIPNNVVLGRASIKEYLNEIGRDTNVKIGRGRAKSYISLKVAIRIAIDLSPKFADEVIETFINKKLTHLRDLGGDKYIELNDAVTAYAESILGKPAHKGHYITIAKLIKERLGVEDWNTAKPEQHAERMRIEQTIVSMLKTGVVRDWEHLKELVDKI